MTGPELDAEIRHRQRLAHSCGISDRAAEHIRLQRELEAAKRRYRARPWDHDAARALELAQEELAAWRGRGS